MPPAGAADYVELRCRSAFSFLEGASSPEDLAARAVEQGHAALALGDREGLYGAPRFHAAARSAGLRPILGAELALTEGAPEERGHLLLLVESPRGWRNLCRLVTRAQGRAPKGATRLAWEDVEEHAAGLTALVRGTSGLTRRFLDRAVALFGPGRDARLGVDVARPRERRAEAAGRAAAALAEAAGVPVLASGDVRYAAPADRRLLDAFTCLRAGTTLDRAGRRLLPNAEHALRSPARMAERFADRPAWLRATRAVAERCEFALEELGYRFPDFPVAPGETQPGRLRRLAFRGARQRWGDPLPARVRAQLEHELGVIERLELAGYFLIVDDIARYARERGILVQGRGSAANSAVCYALGVTAVDAVGMDLLFERFLSEERGEWPDIDLDLPSGEPREAVIRYVFDRYGPHGVGMTATVIAYRARSAVREMGKVLGFAPGALERLARLAGGLDPAEDRAGLAAAFREAGIDPEAPRAAQLLDLVGRARGLPRHLGQHTGGLVIAAGRLDEVVPLEPAAMPGRTVVQWDKEDCEDLGIIKIDLLGLGMLTALEEILPLVRAHEGVAIDLARLPQGDPATYAMIRRADTAGVFQIESRAQMATLPRMQPRRFYDLVVAIALIRPGPITGRMVHPYLERRAGRAPVTYPHPALEPILERTLGVPLFQEQLLRIAMGAAGLAGGEAEELRRAMGFKRSRERMARLETRLREGMRRRGITGEAQEEVMRGITSFALYGFPESHSASFALLAYASAYLKAHHPAAFLAGLLNAWPMGFYSPATLVKDAERHGVEVRPACVAASEWACTLEAGAEGSGPAVRVGLRYVRGLRAEASRALAAERRRAPFRSAADLAARVALRRDELDTLAEAGALAGVDRERAATRRAALWQVAALERDPGSLLAGVEPAEEPSPLAEMTPLETTLADYRTSGLTTGPHLLAHLRPRLRARGLLATEAVRAAPHGRRVRTAGHVIVRQRPGSAKGVCFLTLEDETGTANAVMTPRAFRRLRGALHASPLAELEGRVERGAGGVVHVRVRSLRPLPTGEAAGEAELPSSHDYR